MNMLFSRPTFAVISALAIHHLDDAGKELALSEARRVLRPGGRLVLCDMMFSLSLEQRDRRLVIEKVAGLLKRGPRGLIRILRGPRDADRMMAAQLVGTGGIASLLLLGAVARVPAAIDVALTLALLATFASIAFVKKGLSRLEAEEPRSTEDA